MLKKILIILSLSSSLFISNSFANDTIDDYKAFFMEGCVNNQDQDLVEVYINMCDCVWTRVEANHSINEIKEINELENKNNSKYIKFKSELENNIPICLDKVKEMMQD